MPVRHHHFRFSNWLVGALTIVMLTPLGVLAQGASPPPCEWNRPTTREEFQAELREHFAISTPEHHGSAVTILETNLTPTLVPLAAPNVQSRFALSWIYESLVDRSPIDGQPMPKLADSWEISADGKTFTFHLNRDATWHDGTDVTAADVEFTYDVALEGTFRRAPDQRMISSYEVVDADTFRITATDAFATFLHGTALVPIMPHHVWADIPVDQWKRMDQEGAANDLALAVGTGPFKLVDNQPNVLMRYERNEDYYDIVPSVAELVIEQVAQGSDQRERLIAGDIHFVETSDEGAIQEQLDNGSIKLSETFRTYRMRYYAYNLDPERTTLFQDKLVRQALFVAIDRDAALYEAGVNGNVALGTQPLLSCAHAPDQFPERYDTDPERARELLAHAGWTDTDGDGTVEKDGEPFEFEFLYNQEAPEIVRIANQLQADWQKIGVTMINDRGVPWNEYTNRFSVGDYDLAIQFLRWDPSGNQGALFRADGPMNTMKYHSDAYEDADWEQRRELDPDARRERLIELSNLVWDDLPVGVLYFYRSAVAYNPSIHNFYPNDYGGTYWSIPYVWVDE